MAENALPEFRQLLKTPAAAELGPEPRAGTQTQAALAARLKVLFARFSVPSRNQQLIRPLIFLWHDHLEAAHTLSQAIEDADGSYLHAIMHRREPDYDNAKYWFHRVGRHICYPEIARRVGVSPFTAQGKWDAVAFVDACAAASPPALDLREIQRREFEVLLDYFCTR